jgi:peptidoglycan/LPS O-acetylase OafA/YrhL
MAKRFPGLDHLRAAAIILVFFFHYGIFGDHPDWIVAVGSFGWTGVDLFFVLSGFLIAGELFSRIREGKGLGMGLFYTKRIFRIIPVYVVVLACYFAIPAFKEAPNLSPWWKYLTFTQNFGLNLSHTRAFTHAWSLCVEEQFYLLLPFTLLLLTRYRVLRFAPWLLGLLFVAGFFVRAYGWTHFVQDSNNGVAWHEYIYYPTYNRLDGLLTGIGLAAIYQFLPVWRDRILSIGNVLLLAGLIILSGTAYFLSGQSFLASVFAFPLIAIAYGCITAAAISPSCFLHRFNSRITHTIAILSYAIYLSHKAMIHLSQMVFAHWGMETDGIWVLLLCAAVCVLAAYALRFLVEKPSLWLRNKFIQTR